MLDRRPAGDWYKADRTGSTVVQQDFFADEMHDDLPLVNRLRDDVRRKVNFQGENPCELGLQKYVERIVERLRDGILPDGAEGKPPLLPLLNRYTEIGTAGEVDFRTTRPVWSTQHSHIDQVVADTKTWESSTAFRLEQCVEHGSVRF